MQKQSCEQLLSEMEYKKDIRKPPDNKRRGQFKAGWEDFTLRGEVYEENTLKLLTWHNLGYRLAKKFGNKPFTQIQEMYEQFAQHYRATKLVGEEIPIAEEITDKVGVFREGSVRQIIIDAYERNSEARIKCIAHYGCCCVICKFDFGEKYGQVGEGFIHVHHLRQLSDIGEEYEVDPIEDLRPVCPNCHAIIHKRKPPYTIEEVCCFLVGTVQ